MLKPNNQYQVLEKQRFREFVETSHATGLPFIVTLLALCDVT